jgi:hypothetical protein
LSVAKKISIAALSPDRHLTARWKASTPAVQPTNRPGPSAMETATLNMSGIYQDQSNLIPLDPQTFIQKALDLLASDRYLEKGMG